jgi:hypothetical protein
MNAITVQPLKQLDKALSGLRQIGLLPADTKSEEAPVVALIDKIAHLDPDKAIAIARTLAQASLFNQVVREQIDAMRIGERYKAIAEGFDSIRDDAKRMVDQIDDGKLDTMERLSNMWMKVTRGDIPSRFDRIKDTYLEVAGDAKDQIQREQVILDAYRDFRGALKESQVLAYGLLKQAEIVLDAAKAQLQTAGDALAANASTDREVMAGLELERDRKLRAVQDEDKRYQIAKDLAENLSIAHNTSDVIMARLMQITDAKERVYSQAVTFFGTNETVFTALSASFTGMHGLHESTQALEAMKEGINKSLETLGEVGDRIQEEAVRAGYGPTIRAESVKKLVDAVINFQEKSQTIIAEMRVLAEKNEIEVREAVEDGKRRLVQLAQQAHSLPGPTTVVVPAG